MNDNSAEDIGAPQSYLVLADGTPVHDRSGNQVGTVEHVLADEGSDIFHGLIIKTADGHRFAGGDQIDGIYERAVIVAVPADQLPEPAEGQTEGPLKRAWDWLVQPR